MKQSFSIFAAVMISMPAVFAQSSPALRLDCPSPFRLSQKLTEFARSYDQNYGGMVMLFTTSLMMSPQAASVDVAKPMELFVFQEGGVPVYALAASPKAANLPPAAINISGVSLQPYPVPGGRIVFAGSSSAASRAQKFLRPCRSDLGFEFHPRGLKDFQFTPLKLLNAAGFKSGSFRRFTDSAETVRGTADFPDSGKLNLEAELVPVPGGELARMIASARTPVFAPNELRILSGAESFIVFSIPAEGLVSDSGVIAAMWGSCAGKALACTNSSGNTLLEFWLKPGKSAEVESMIAANSRLPKTSGGFYYLGGRLGCARVRGNVADFISHTKSPEDAEALLNGRVPANVSVSHPIEGFVVLPDGSVRRCLTARPVNGNLVFSVRANAAELPKPPALRSLPPAAQPLSE